MIRRAVHPTLVTDRFNLARTMLTRFTPHRDSIQGQLGIKWPCHRALVKVRISSHT